MSTLRTGARTPFFADDITYYHNLATTNFSPIEDNPAVFTATQTDWYAKNGFLAMNATDNAGLLYVVTWNAFQVARLQANRTLVTDATVLGLLVPIPIYLASGDWVMTPIVKAYGTGVQEYISTVTYINIGIIR